MEKFRIYKDLETTYAEVEKALLQLGFQNASDSERFYFVHKNIKLFLLCP